MFQLTNTQDSCCHLEKENKTILGGEIETPAGCVSATVEMYFLKASALNPCWLFRVLGY